MAQEHTNEKSLAEDVKEQQKNVESLDAEVRRCRDLRHNIHTVIDPLKVRVFFPQEKMITYTLSRIIKCKDL